MSTVTDLLFPVLAGAVALVASRLARRGSVSRLWVRLWLYTWRERVRSLQRQRREVHRAAALSARRAAAPRPRDLQSAPQRLVRAQRPANEGVWVGNVFRPDAFQPAAVRRLRNSR